MNRTAIDNTEALKRYAKVSSKIFFKLNLGQSSITAETHKGKFLKMLEDLQPTPVSAEFDGDIVTVFGGINAVTSPSV